MSHVDVRFGTHELLATPAIDISIGEPNTDRVTGFPTPALKDCLLYVTITYLS